MYGYIYETENLINGKKYKEDISLLAKNKNVSLPSVEETLSPQRKLGKN